MNDDMHEHSLIDICVGDTPEEIHKGVKGPNRQLNLHFAVLDTVGDGNAGRPSGLLPAIFYKDTAA